MNKELKLHIEEEMKWLKKTYHTTEHMKPEFQKWYDHYAEERFHELQSLLNYAKQEKSE